MTQFPMKGRTALVLGADNAVGRGAALQFARAGGQVIVAGPDTEAIKLLHRLILDKKGNPVEAALPETINEAVALLREKRDLLGHVHYLINAMHAVEGADDAWSRKLYAAVLDLIAGRGAVRLATIWPDDAGSPPPFPSGAWHTLVRFARLAREDQEETSDSLRPGAVAEATLALLHCPPGACPLETRLGFRPLKG